MELLLSSPYFTLSLDFTQFLLVGIIAISWVKKQKLIKGNLSTAMQLVCLQSIFLV